MTDLEFKVDDVVFCSSNYCSFDDNTLGLIVQTFDGFAHYPYRVRIGDKYYLLSEKEVSKPHFDLKHKILILGYGRNGKDTVAQMLNELDSSLRFTSSSMYAANKFIFNSLKDVLGYKTAQECYDDRHTGENRILWYQLIRAYNSKNRTRLATEMINDGFSMYVGMRCKEELLKAKDEFNLIIWVDSSKRTVAESTESCTIDLQLAKDCGAIVIDNNGSEDDLKSCVKCFYDMHIKE